ncbi:MAG: thiolase family protein, partial [Candidatus Krumholzibacteria bacterium]|nr:thiolase family protein [Candidatus Krumholzibacteria bacterium]
ALGALVTHSYLREYDVPTHSLDWIAVKNHRHAALNPKAHFRNHVTAEEVATSPLVADPLRRLHCAPMSDGAAAVLLSRKEGDVGFVGFAKGVDVPLFQERRNLARFVATARAGEAARAQSRTTQRDIDIVEIHDAFSSFEMINLEEIGFYPHGHAWKALASGELGINGKLAVNSSGGMKAKGHPIGATGLSSCVELHEQLTGAAGARQHRGARLGMIQSAGGVSNESYIFILDNA